MKLSGAAGGKLGGPDFPAKLPAGFSLKHPADAGMPRSGVPPSGASGGEVQDRGQIPQTAASQFAVFKDLARSLGIPQDTLSSSLFSFIRFFSLPLDTKLLQRLRQEVLSLKTPQKDRSPTPMDRIRPGALAAAAATGKGLALSTEALEKYAAAIAGEEGDGGDTGGGWNGSSAGHGGGSGDGDRGQSGTGHHGAEHAEQLRDMVERIEGKSPLLGILNKLPGKDGRRWINLPFSFSSGGVDYSVSLRLLLADTNALPWKAECLALDIATDSRRWSFTLENAGKSGGTPREVPVFTRALVRIHPPPKQLVALEGSLRELLGTVAEEIILKDMTEGAFCEEFFFEEGYPR